jgi:hypothetical protein
MNGRCFITEFLLLLSAAAFPLASSRFYVAAESPAYTQAEPAARLELREEQVEGGEGAAGPPPAPSILAGAFFAFPAKPGVERSGRAAGPQAAIGAPQGSAPPGETRDAAEPWDRTSPPEQRLKYIGLIRDADDRELLYIKDTETGSVIGIGTGESSGGIYRVLTNTPELLILQADNLVYEIEKE